MYAPLILIPSSPHALLCHRDFRETKQGVTPLLCSVILRDQCVEILPTIVYLAL